MVSAEVIISGQEIKPETGSTLNAESTRNSFSLSASPTHVLSLSKINKSIKKKKLYTQNRTLKYLFQPKKINENEEYRFKLHNYFIPLIYGFCTLKSKKASAFPNVLIYEVTMEISVNWKIRNISLGHLDGSVRHRTLGSGLGHNLKRRRWSPTLGSTGQGACLGFSLPHSPCPSPIS